MFNWEYEYKTFFQKLQACLIWNQTAWLTRWVIKAQVNL